MDVWYCTRESVLEALGQTTTPARRIDRAIEASTDMIVRTMHRSFHPEVTTASFDWPGEGTIWFDGIEFIEIDSVTSDGTTIDLSTLTLEPANTDEPYQWIRSRSPISGNASRYRSVEISGTAGYRDDETSAATLESAPSSADTTIDVTPSDEIGVGSLLRIGTERMTVTARRWLNTSLELAAGLTATAQATVLTLTGLGTMPIEGESLLIDGERVTVTDVNGSQVLVRRAESGTVLAAHATSTPIYALRRLVVRRGVVGTEAAAHSDGAAVFVWQPPADIAMLCRAQAVATMLDLQSGMARQLGAGESAVELTGQSLGQLWRAAKNNYQRRARIRAVT